MAQSVKWPVMEREAPEARRACTPVPDTPLSIVPVVAKMVSLALVAVEC